MFNKEKRYTLTHYLFGALPARLGDEMSGQAILLMGLALTGSVALGSTALAALTFSAAIGGPLLGAILDRSPHPGRVLAYALGLYAVGISCIALSLGHMPVWVSIAIALAAGFLMPAISGGWSSRLKSFIADEQMTRASAIDATTFNIAGLAGPAIAGLIAAIFGAHWAVVGLVVLLVAALPMAWSLPRKTIQKSHAQTSTFIQDVMAGFKIIVQNKKLFRITLVSVISYMGIGMLWVIYPLVGQELFGNAGYGGILASVVSVGALVATIAYAKWPTKHSPDVIAFITTLILGVAMLILAFSGNIALALIAMLVVGLADGPQLAAIFAVRHREAPERSRGQVFTTGASLKITAAAVGATLAGQLAGSLRFTIIVACFVQVAAATVFILAKK
ncbi:MAG TPA: MFS transporter [Candidatus Saccharimonadales bacterium]|nr:MFS transporter [Candidatus Saccharimonadales bacterium]